MPGKHLAMALNEALAREGREGVTDGYVVIGTTRVL